MLDFDGVLNSAEFQERTRALLGKKVSFWNRLDPLAVSRLNRILKETKAEVVVISSWRRFSDSNTVERLQAILDLHGFAGRVIDMTPVLDCLAHETDNLTCDQAHRGYEIAVWFAAQQEKPAFVILDDGSDMIPNMDRLVQTAWDTGLRDEHADRAISMLKVHGP